MSFLETSGDIVLPLLRFLQGETLFRNRGLAEKRHFAAIRVMETRATGSMTEGETDDSIAADHVAQAADPITTSHSEWLGQQLQWIGGARAGLVVIHDDGKFRPTAIWPAPAAVQPLVELVGQAIKGTDGLVTPLSVPEGSQEAPTHAIALPVRIGDQIVAVAAIAFRAQTNQDVDQSTKLLKWGAAGLELIHLKQDGSPAPGDVAALSSAIDSIAAVHTEKSAKAAALAFVTELARQLHCDRVSIGFLKGGRTRLYQISHNPDFEGKMNISRLIEEAMDEAIDQRSTVNIGEGATGGDPQAVHMACDRLAEMTGRSATLTVPLLYRDEPLGAVMLERTPTEPFTATDVAMVESTATLIAPSLYDKRLNDMNIFAKIGKAFRSGLTIVLGKKHTVWKLSILVLTISTILLATIDVPYRESFDARLSGEVQRIVAAPFDGYIDAAPIRSGDTVSEGQTLVTLDDTTYQLDRLKWLGEAARIDGLYQDALAKRDRSEINILAAQRSQAQAQLDLVEQQIARSAIKAPFAGLVVSGDLSQRLGGIVNAGDELFVLAPLDRFRLDMRVKESRIADLEVGQTGSLLLPAFPGERFDVTIEKITPETLIDAGTTYFLVEGSLDRTIDGLQPGMEGVSKIEIGRAPPLVIWTRDLVEWVRIRLWYWMG